MNETLQTIHSLRTIHGNFSARDVSEEHLQMILEATMKAANASARQSYSIVVVENRDTMRQLGYVGSKALVFCVDYTRIVDTAEFLHRQFYSQEIVSFVTGFVDTVLAAQTAAIAAKSLQIDSMFTNCIHRAKLEDVYQILQLPKAHCFPVIELILGYPEKEPTEHKGRLSGKGIIHREKYRRLSPDELSEVIAEYDDKEKHIGMITNWEELGFAHYLDWFYEKWSGKIPQEKQHEFYQALSEAGFLKTE